MHNIIDIKDRKTQLTLGVVVMAIGLAGYSFATTRPVYGPSSVGIEVTAKSSPAPVQDGDRAVRGPSSNSAPKGDRLQADSTEVVGNDPEASDTQEKKNRKGPRAGSKRNRKSADQDMDEQEKKEQRSPDTRQRGAPFRKAPKGL